MFGINHNINDTRLKEIIDELEKIAEKFGLETAFVDDIYQEIPRPLDDCVIQNECEYSPYKYIRNRALSSINITIKGYLK